MHPIIYISIIIGVPSYLCLLAIRKPRQPLTYKGLLICLLFPPLAWGKQTYSLIEHKLPLRKAMITASLISLTVYLSFMALSEIVRNSGISMFHHSLVVLWFLVPTGHMIYFTLRTKRP